MYAQPTLNGTPVIPTTYANITTFGNTSVKIIPIPATYQNGYLPGQGFPAENENYLMFNLTNSVNAIANDLANIHAEILTVLSGQSIPVNNSATQLNAAIGSKITSTITGTYINNALTGAGINTTLIAYGGNVGIGKSPSNTLDVNGNINGNSVSIAGVSIGTSLTTLQTNINTEATTARNANNLTSGTVPLGRISGLTDTQTAGSFTSAAMAFNYKFTNRIDLTGSGTSGAQVLPTPLSGEVIDFWFKANSNSLALPSNSAYMYTIYNGATTTTGHAAANTVIVSTMTGYIRITYCAG